MAHQAGSPCEPHRDHFHQELADVTRRVTSALFSANISHTMFCRHTVQHYTGSPLGTGQQWTQYLPLAHSMSRHLLDPGPDLGSLQVLGPGLNMTHSTPSLTHTHHPVQPVQCSTVQSHSISDKCNENVHILSSAPDDKSFIPTHAVQ